VHGFKNIGGKMRKINSKLESEEKKLKILGVLERTQNSISKFISYQTQ
jgi:hypothetical protein